MASAERALAEAYARIQDLEALRAALERERDELRVQLAAAKRKLAGSAQHDRYGYGPDGEDWLSGH